MPEKLTRTFVAGRDQIRLLCSPVRQEIVDTIAGFGGEATVAALAEQLGRPADGLYYHLRALVDGGLVAETENSGGDERRYCLVGVESAPFRLVYDVGQSGVAEALRRFARGLLQIAGQDFNEALETDGVIVSGPKRELWASRNKGWLSPDDIAEVNHLLERLGKLTSQSKAAGRERLMSCAFVIAPINPRPKRRAG